MRFRPLLPVLVLLFCLGFATPAKAEKPQAPSPTADRLLCLPIQTGGPRPRLGSSVPIGEHEALSSAHIVQLHMRLFSPEDYFIPTAVAEIFIAGQPAKLETFSTDDRTAVRLRVWFRFPKWLPTGEARIGEAFVIRDDVVGRIEITDTETGEFKGWKAFPGASGSPIVQFLERGWTVVGVIRARRCDNCGLCIVAPRECHCPKEGLYSRALPRAQ